MSRSAHAGDAEDGAGEVLGLRCIQGGLEGRRLQVRGDRPVILGRSEACDLRVDPEVDRVVSGRHLEFRREAGRWWVADLGSSNGTTLNGTPVQGKVALESGDRLELGAGSAFAGVVFEVMDATADVDGPSASPDARGRTTPPPPPPPGITGRPSSPPAIRRLPDGGVAFPCPACGATQHAEAEDVGRRKSCLECGGALVVPIPVSISARPGAAGRRPKGEDPSRGFGSGADGRDAVDRLLGGGLRRVREGVGRLRSGSRRRELERELDEFERRLEELHEAMGRHLLDCQGPDRLREASPAFAAAFDDQQSALEARDAEQSRIDREIADADRQAAATAKDLERLEQTCRGVREAGVQSEARLRDLVETRRSILAPVVDSLMSVRQQLDRIPAGLDDPAVMMGDVLRESCETSARTLSELVDSMPDVADVEEEMGGLWSILESMTAERVGLEAQQATLKERFARCGEAANDARALVTGEVMVQCRQRLEESDRSLARAFAQCGRDAMERTDPVAVASELFPEVRSMERRIKEVREAIARLDGGDRHG